MRLGRWHNFVLTTKMEIRAIADRDLKPISQLYISIFSSPPWNEHWEYKWAYERLNWIYQSQGFMGFIARDKNEVTGAILGHFVPFKGKKGFKLVEFFVDINCQNRGIGTKLLTRLELSLKNDYDFVLLLTAKNTDAESFYLNRDYRRDDKLVLLRREI